MEIITRTLWGADLQASLLLGLPYVPKDNTTLNEKFDIEAGAVYDASAVSPKLQYLAIGNQGHKIMTGAEGIQYTSPVNHRASDAALFNHIPFVLRTVDNDLTVSERANYALRRQETHNGVNYFAYYLKRMDLSGIVTELQKSVVLDGVSTTTPYAPTTDNLSPIPPETASEGVILSDGTFLSTSAILDLAFSASDVANLIEVATIMYENENMAVVSEVALCSGIDKTVTGPATGNTQINYVEAIAVQVATFITTYYAMAFSNQGFGFKVELGATEPLLGE